ERVVRAVFPVPYEGRIGPSREGVRALSGYRPGRPRGDAGGRDSGGLAGQVVWVCGPEETLYDERSAGWRGRRHDSRRPVLLKPAGCQPKLSKCHAERSEASRRTLSVNSVQDLT